MTRPWLVVLCLACCLPVQAADAPRDAEQRQFLSHQPGQALLAGPGFALAREVQEGCPEPCAAPAEIAAYLKKVGAAGSGLGLDPGQQAEARKHYAPDGVPRRKLAAAAASRAVPRLRPGLGAQLDATTHRWAEALGLTRWMSADGATLDARTPAGARPPAPAPRPAAAKGPGVPVLRAAPLDPAQVDRKFNEALNSEVARYPTGSRLLGGMKSPPRVTLEKLDSPDTIAQHTRRLGRERIAINTMRAADVLRGLDAGSAKAGDLADPAVLRGYLAEHPALIPKLAQAFDTWYVHELTHAAQYRLLGTGLINDTVNGWIDILNGKKYPVEKEWDAFGTQNRYFGEKAKADPSVLRMNGPFPSTVLDYTDYIENLTKYRKNILSTYQGDVDTLDKLRLHGRSEKSYYQAALAQEQAEWPRRSAEGHILVSRSWTSQDVPTMGLTDLKTACDLASGGKFLETLRPDLTAAFQAALAAIEARLAKSEAEKKPWTLGEMNITLIKQIAAVLKVSLPPRVAKAVAKK